jgi:hypothetical protein
VPIPRNQAKRLSFFESVHVAPAIFRVAVEFS